MNVNHEHTLCVARGQYLLSDTGYKKAEDIQIGDTVFSDETFVKVKKTDNRDKKGVHIHVQQNPVGFGSTYKELTFGEQTLVVHEKLAYALGGFFETGEIRGSDTIAFATRADDQYIYDWCRHFGKSFIFEHFHIVHQKDDNSVVRKLQLAEQLPYETAKYAIFCRTCETTNRVVEQVQWFNSKTLLPFRKQFPICL